MIALAGCSGGSASDTSSNSSSSTGGKVSGASPATGDNNAEAANYPDWAQAVAPPYPKVSAGFLVNTNLYQLETSDDVATVATWYKAKVNGTWTTDATSGSQTATVGGVSISISKDPAGKTMININHN